ncbi:MAG TPA: SDR family NAD(P)-dependent oxidoreductase [Anaerolineales bacterium]|nr:SDR family NAD(P)-dependent oxidoreductase [Anaerolineales bacterium]
MDDITGKIALVTGGDRGIGRGIAIALAQAGADVVVNYHTNVDKAHQVHTEIEGLKRRSLTIQADITKTSAITAMVQKVEKEMGAIEILVNNAGVNIPQSWEEVDEASWDKVVDTNLRAAFFVTQAVLPGMRARGWGRIIFISSVAAQIGGFSGPHYAASKAGMFGLAHYFASTLAKQGITANTIAPALIETDMLAQLPAARPDALPVGRFGKIEEVGEVAVMLARNGYITGQTINVDGGRYTT